MSLKYSSTTADYLQWSEAMNLIRKLAKDGNYKISLLVALGCFTGLRILTFWLYAGSRYWMRRNLPLSKSRRESKGL